MADRFLSYSSADEDFASHVKRELEAQSLPVFMAQASLNPGDKWPEQIREQLASSGTVIFLRHLKSEHR